MLFLIAVEKPGCGSYTMSYLEAPDQQSAQEKLVHMLSAADVPLHRIAQQVSDNTSLRIGNHTIWITPIEKCTQQNVGILAALTS